MKESTNMNDIELRILVGMHRNINRIDKQTSKIASEHGLTFSQFAVLEALYSKGDMSVGEIREHILSSMGTIPVIINNLVKMKYVQRCSDMHDRRICRMSLTNEGKKIIQEIVPKNKAMIKKYLGVLTEEEKSTLLFLMKKVGGKINEETNTK